MKSIVLQMVVLAAVAGGAAAVSNTFASGNDERHLDWWPKGRYPNATQVRGCETPPTVAPIPVVPEVPSDGTPPAPPVEAPGGTAPEVASETPTPAEDGHDPDDGEDHSDHEHAKFPPIYFDGAVEAFQAGATFIDARRTKEYVDGHIPGAFSVPAWESPDAKISALLDEVGVVSEAPAVVYCSSSKECEDSLIISNLLEQAGFTDVSIYKGGFPEWAHKLPKAVVLGAEPGEADPDAVEGGEE